MRSAIYKYDKTVSVVSLIVIMIFIFTVWFLSERSVSYDEPFEAVFAVEEDLLLIPSYKYNDKALFFFIKGKSNFGATYAHKGKLGWKTGGLSWSSTGNLRDFNKLNNIQSNGKGLIYGLIKYKDNITIRMDGNNAVFLALDVMMTPKIVEEYQLEDLGVWYFENVVEGETVELVNDRGVIIDSIIL